MFGCAKTPEHSLLRICKKFSPKAEHIEFALEKAFGKLEKLQKNAKKVKKGC